MRVSINLATRPYEDKRAFITRWSALTGALALLAIALLLLCGRAWNERRQSDRELAAINAQRDKLRSERGQVEAYLNQPQNRGTRDHAQFLNALILRKTFSWTSVFSELEHILPPSVKITAIRPEVDEDNHLRVRMAAESENRTAALDFVRRIEGTRQFRNPHLLRESHGEADAAGNNNQQANPNAVTYEIEAEYVPVTNPGGGQ